jgi:UDP-N-acetylmuramoyl-tripeptide--D-alanyl-D-alanine ligase
VRVESLTLNAQAQPRFQLVTADGAAKVSLQLSGAHYAMNAAAAAAVGLAEGMSLADITRALGEVTEVSAHRMRVTPRDDGLLVVDDAYNANPESVRAALDALAVLADSRRGASWAVLGEMRELGANSADLHAAVGRHAATLGIEHLVVVGDGAKGISSGAQAVSEWAGTVDVVSDVERASALVEAAVSGSDVVLVKASNAVALWQVAESLMRSGGQTGAAE